MSAILTGTYPQSSRLPTATDYPRNIFSLLGGTHQVVAHEPVTQLCPDQLCGKPREGLARRLNLLLSDLSIVYLHTILPHDMTFPLPPVTQKWGDFASSERRKKSPSEQFMDFVSTIHSAEKPTLYFLHIVLPHSPYNYLPSGKRYATVAQNRIRQGDQGGRHDDEWAVVQGYQGHLLQVGFADTLIGRLLARLKKVGLYDRSLIVVTADHGVSFRKGDSRRWVTKTNYQDILPVPLLVKAPSQRDARIDDRNVETVDILPLMADILDVRLPWPVDGDSPLDLSARERYQKLIIRAKGERMPFVSSVVESRKYLTLKRKLALFGSGNHPDGLFKIGPNSKLVGQTVKDLRIAKKGTVAINLDNPNRFLNVKPTSNFIPALVTGKLRLASDVDANLKLAIAINGTIQAMTRTYPLPGVLPGKNKLACWSAVVDERSFHPGQNDVEVLILRSSSGKAILEPTAETTKLPASLDYRNVALGDRWVWGVRESGFYGRRGNNGRRWTNGAAKLVVPIDENRPPQVLKVDLASTGPKGTQLTVLVNSDVLFHESVPRGRWSKTFSLAGRSFNKHLTLELLSDTVVPRETTGSTDGRSLGVMVEAITLLDSNPVDSFAEKETTKPLVHSDYRNVVLGGHWVWGIEESGFHGQEWLKEDTPIRWTDGAGKLVVPMHENRLPQALRVDIAWTGPKGTQLTVLVNSDVLFHESLPPGGWAKTFSLAGRSFNQQLSIELLSDTFVPAEVKKGTNDRRTLGVQVRAITLLDSDPVDSIAEGAPGK